ncbi:MAG: GNAT family N-acetyltransferase [Defluviitaleaceae bacterium]|nr:GNAT family N-acetyltransferase [Defluviitaleaceae bacterium]
MIDNINFVDVKAKMDDPAILDILAACVYDNSPEGMAREVSEYHRHGSWQLRCWIDDGKIVGVCGFEVHTDWVEILHIAVSENARGRGIGSKMVAALRAQYKMPIEAETDDDAVDFYRKCGFEVTAFKKYDVRRWTCVLHCI